MSINLESLLNDLDATLAGDYYILRCPVCGKREAYLYLDDIKKYYENNNHQIPIRCNRLNKCGETSYLNDNIQIQIDTLPKQKPTVQIKEEGIQLIQKLVNYYCHTLNGNSSDFDFSIRGISNKTLKQNRIIYLKKEFANIINTPHTAPLFSNKYRTPNYDNRDIFIPLFNYSNECERILLRSKDPSPEQKKKEIQLMLIQGGIDIWNIQDLIRDDINYIFITEGVYDGLSFKEINQQFGVISLPGVKKYKKIIKEIKKNLNICKSKKFIIATDNDKAGEEYSHKLEAELDALGIQHTAFDLKHYKDANEFLVKNKIGFMLSISKALKNLKEGK